MPPENVCNFKNIYIKNEYLLEYLIKALQKYTAKSVPSQYLSYYIGQEIYLFVKFCFKLL